MNTKENCTNNRYMNVARGPKIVTEDTENDINLDDEDIDNLTDEKAETIKLRPYYDWQLDDNNMEESDFPRVSSQVPLSPKTYDNSVFGFELEIENDEEEDEDEDDEDDGFLVGSDEDVEEGEEGEEEEDLEDDDMDAEGEVDDEVAPAKPSRKAEAETPRSGTPPRKKNRYIVEDDDEDE